MKIISLMAAAAIAMSLTVPAASQSVVETAKTDAENQAAPQRTTVDLEPAGVAPGTTVRQARIAQNWLLLGLGSAALAGIILGLSSSDNDVTTTTN